LDDFFQFSKQHSESDVDSTFYVLSEVGYFVLQTCGKIQYFAPGTGESLAENFLLANFWYKAKLAVISGLLGVTRLPNQRNVCSECSALFKDPF